MPIYEYKCPQCNDVFEEWVKSHAQTAECPNCKAEAVQIISNTTFVLKGGGWYVTEYGNRKNDVEPKSAQTSKNNDASTSTKSSTTDTTNSTKTDTKAASTTSTSNVSATKKPPSKGAAKTAS